MKDSSDPFERHSRLHFGRPGRPPWSQVFQGPANFPDRPARQRRLGHRAVRCRSQQAWRCPSPRPGRTSRVHAAVATSSRGTGLPPQNRKERCMDSVAFNPRSVRNNKDRLVAICTASVALARVPRREYAAHILKGPKRSSFLPADLGRNEQRQNLISGKSAEPRQERLFPASLKELTDRGRLTPNGASQ